MPNRIGPTILTATLAATVLNATLAATVLAGGPAAGDDKCLAAPNAAPSQGTHWYYYVDRAQRRHCWYLGPENRPVHHAESDAQPPAKSAAPTSAPMEAPLPLQRPAAARGSTAGADVETFIERPREEGPAMVRSPEPAAALGAGEWQPGNVDLREMATSRAKTAAPVAARALDPLAIFFLILIAVAGAAAGITYRAIFSAKPARYRPPARLKGVRAGRIASLASDRAPRTLTAPRPESRRRAQMQPTELPNIEEEIRELVLASRAENRNRAQAQPGEPPTFEEEIQELVLAMESRAA